MSKEVLEAIKKDIDCSFESACQGIIDPWIKYYYKFKKNDIIATSKGMLEFLVYKEYYYRFPPSPDWFDLNPSDTFKFIEERGQRIADYYMSISWSNVDIYTIWNKPKLPWINPTTNYYKLVFYV